MCGERTGFPAPEYSVVGTDVPGAGGGAAAAGGLRR